MKDLHLLDILELIMPSLKKCRDAEKSSLLTGRIQRICILSGYSITVAARIHQASEVIGISKKIWNDRQGHCGVLISVPSVRTAGRVDA